VGKNKLARWNEIGTYENVIQPEIGEVFSKDHSVKGKWNKEVFKNDNPLILELGCGKGEYTTGLAAVHPEKNFIGVDIKGARIWRGAKTANDNKMPNVAFLRTRIEFISSFFMVDEIDEIWITFPDPHPGGRQANKRLTSPPFLNSYRKFLKDSGLVHLKTDNTELFRFTEKVAAKNNLEIVYSTEDLYSSHPDMLSIKTHYEKLFLNKGMKINYLSFRLRKEKTIEYDPGKEKSS